MRELVSLQARLTAVGNMIERKKNGTDPLNNPVRLFRHSKEEVNRVSIQGYKNAVFASNKQQRKKAEVETHQMLIAMKEHSAMTRIRKMQEQALIASLQ